MSKLLCALASCSQDMTQINPSYKLGNDDAEFCSRACVTQAYELRRRGKRFSRTVSQETVSTEPEEQDEEIQDMQQLAADFGDAGIIRRFCDNRKCRKPITLSWRGRNGEYCSNDCLKLIEKGQGNIMTTEDTNTDSPIISAGAAKPKKGKAAPAPAPAKKGKEAPAPAPAKKGKAAPAPAPAKKGKEAPAAPSKVGRAKFSDEAVIKVKSEEHGMRGKRAEAIEAILKASTIGKAKATLAKKDLSGYMSWAMGQALSAGLVTVVEP